jgi:hypothetical protein
MQDAGNVINNNEENHDLVSDIEDDVIEINSDEEILVSMQDEILMQAELAKLPDEYIITLLRPSWTPPRRNPIAIIPVRKVLPQPFPKK